MNKLIGIFKKIDKVRLRKLTAVVLTILIGIFVTFWILAINLGSKTEKYMDEMMETVSASEGEYRKNVYLDENYMSSMESVAQSLAGYAAFYFNENGYSGFTREELSDVIGDVCLIYYYNGFKSSLSEVEKGYIKSDKNLQYELDDIETYKVLNDGIYSKGGVNYTSCQIDPSSYVIIRWTAEEIYTKNSIMEAYSSGKNQYVFRINTKTGIIEDSSEAEYVGEQYDESIDISSFKRENGYIYGITDIEGRGLCLTVVSDNIEGQMIVCYIPFADISYDYLSGLILPSAFIWVFLIMIMLYVIRFIMMP